jgi:preprotein translocase subunit YajC
MEAIANYGWLLLVAFMTLLIIKIIVNTVRNERNRKSFSPNMKPGDQVIVPTGTDHYSGEILEVNGDEVKIVVTASKNRVYPLKDKLSNTDKLIGAFKNRKQ